MKMADEALQFTQRIIACHREGLDRAVRLAIKSPNYSEILNGKIAPRHLDLFDRNAPLEERASAAVEENREALTVAKLRIAQLRHGGLCCFGATRNNLLEFEFFDAVVNAGYSILENNLSRAPRAEREISEGDRAIIDAVLADVKAFYSSLDRLDSSIFHQQFLYTRSYLTYALALRDPDTVLPSLFVISNDHMPVHVAISLVMKAAGVPRAYMQHAEVSDAFPPLDFEFSVLRSAQSLETYRSIGPITGRTFIVPRAAWNIDLEALTQDRGSDVNVVIYPTARLLEAELKLAVSGLKENPLVSSVMIKPHPNSSPPVETVLDGADVVILREPPTGDHIALVGNSSIAVELLRKGVQVYQTFDIDPIPRDYYGFVAEGLVPEAPLAELGGKFWGSYPTDERWVDAFRKRAPNEDAASQEARQEFAAAVRPHLMAPRSAGVAVDRALSGRSRQNPAHRLAKGLARRGVRMLIARAPRLAARLADAIRRHLPENGEMDGKRTASEPPTSVKGQRAVFALGLSAARDPVAFLSRGRQERFVSDLDAIVVVERLFHDRDPVLNELFKDLAGIEPGPVRTWISLKKAEWTLACLGDDEMRELADFVYGYQGNAWLRRKLADTLLTVLLQSGSRNEIERFFESVPDRSPQDLSLNRQVALLRRLAYLSAPQEELTALRRSFEIGASPFSLLKLRNMDALEGVAPEGWRHAQAEADFAKHAPSSVADEFRAEVLPIYERLRSRLALIDVRNEPEQLAAARQGIVVSLQNAEPYSLLRLSDGEGFFFAEAARYFGPDDVRNRERHWWGTELPEDLRLEIRELGREALKAADVVGIPSVYRFIRDTSDRSKSLFTGLQGRGLVEVLEGVEAAISDTAVLTEDKINISLFGRPDDTVALAQNARKTVIVSSVQPAVLPERLKALNIETVSVPTHYRTSTNANYSGSDRPLPFVYRPILERIEAASGPGVLVLVAGGIVGKLFVGAAKARGAVAVDIGSAVDDWAAGSVASLR